jgi:AraC family transcriptional regulator
MKARARDGAQYRRALDVHASPRAQMRIWEVDALAAMLPIPRATAHPTVELTWPTDGAMGYAIGNDCFDVLPGSGVIVPSDVEHVTTHPSSLRCTALHIDRNVVAELRDAIGCEGGVAVAVLPDASGLAALGAVLRKEATEAVRGDRGALLAIDAITEAMIALAIRGTPEKRVGDGSLAVPRDARIARAARYIEASYAEPLTIDDIARAARMSRFHFSRRFRDATGRSPYRYLLDVRLERAAELLRRGSCGVVEAALSVGFSDPCRFSNAFRARFGAAPGRWSAATRTRAMCSLPARLAR